MTALPALIRNPAADIRLLASDAEGPLRIVVSAYSVLKGFTETRLDRASEPAFAAVLEIASGSDGALERLAPELALALWGCGLLVLPQELAPPFAPARFAEDRNDFAAYGFALLSGCVSVAMVDAVAGFYRAQVDSGKARLSSGPIDRLHIQNDPAGRVIQHALHPAVEAFVGTPIKSSYCYASLYREGASLPVHVDREQCEYTLSVLIDHRPVPADGVSPWPIQLYPRPGVTPVECYQGIGGGLLFKGRQLSHGRQPLVADQTCWTLLLHYVDADFAGSLD